MRKFYFVLILATIHSLLFTNLFAQTFTEIEVGLPGVQQGSLAWGDYDNDGDLDVLITGYIDDVNSISRVYRNDGNEVFSNISAGLIGVYISSAAWGDYDNDGDLDILLAGYNDLEQYVSKIYRNDGNNIFIDITAELADVYYCSVAWGDYDSDGDLDVLLTGGISTKIYRNDGNDLFIDIQVDIKAVSNSSVDWGDYDNDGDLDILLSGKYNSSGILEVYRNDGGSVFTNINADLTAVFNGSVSWGDYDNDGDLDILRVGYYYDNEYIRVSKVYRNDGAENFTDIDAELYGVSSCSSAWGDYNNDGYLDILISGYNGIHGITKIFKYNGDDTYTEYNETILDSTYYSSVAWGDYDNDGDLDILNSGVDTSGLRITKIYKNNTLDINSVPEKPIGLSALKNSGNVNLKWNHSSDDHTNEKGLSYNLFIGKDSLCENIKSSMSDISNGFHKIAQFGDIVDTFYMVHQLDTGKYYWAVQAIDPSFLGSDFSAIDSFNITFTNNITSTIDQTILPSNDGDTLVVGETGMPNSRQWKYSLVSGGPYIYDIPGETDTIYIPNFNECGIYYVVCESNKDEIAISNEVKISVTIFIVNSNIIIEQLGFSTFDWGDYDNDGDLDLLIAGKNGNDAYTKIYRNDGSDIFTEQLDIFVAGNSFSSVTWGDYNNDGYLDILIGGNNQIILYKNNGDNSFTEYDDIFNDYLGEFDAKWGDYDNDGDLDIIVIGNDGFKGETAKIFKNNGNEEFIEQSEISIEGVRSGSVAWGDYDNDGDLDLAIQGLNKDFLRITKLYKNNGNNTFTEQIDITITNVSGGTIAWGDYDNDNDLDLLLTGYSNENVYISKIYRNDGNNSFIDINAEITGISGPSVWGDYDNDGDLDVLISGYDGSRGSTKLYQNEGGDVFLEINISFMQLYYGNASWDDYDKDGDLDILLSGLNSKDEPETILYENKTTKINTKPEKPIGLLTSVLGDKVNLVWSNANDDYTPKLGLNYNLFVGKSKVSEEIKSSMADISNGYRKISKLGNIVDTSYMIHKLDTGKYYWAVQAVDNAFLGSEFSVVDSFDITFVNRITPVDDQEILPLTNADTLTVHETEIVDSRQWRYSFIPGGPYENIISGETDTIYIPNLSLLKTFYIVCFSTKDGITVISNEVRIAVPQFSNIEKYKLPNVFWGATSWGDFDNDNDLDVVITGNDNSELVTKIFRNDLTGFTDIQANLKGLVYSSVDWGDYNNDGFLDILLIGGLGYESEKFSFVYKNNGDSTFSEQTLIELSCLDNGQAMWSDFNKDGKIDIIISGKNNKGDANTYIYKNNGNNTFSEISHGIKGFYTGDFDIGDYDKDGLLDIIGIGQDVNGNHHVTLYKNEGQFIFSEQLVFGQFIYGSVEFGDYDNNGDLDIIISGMGYYQNITSIYRNEGNNQFTLIEADLQIFYDGDTKWLDYDNDSNLDLVCVGRIDGMSSPFAGIYQNLENNAFDLVKDLTLDGGIGSNISYADYDKDGDLDIYMSKYYYSFGDNALYNNNIITKNTKPTVPVNLSDSVLGKSVILKWNTSIDNETPSQALSYNLFIGSEPDTFDIVNPNSDLHTGFYKLVKRGNTGQDTSFIFSDLPTGKYYWGVQCIDPNSLASEFSIVDSFEIKAPFIKKDLKLSYSYYGSVAWGDYDNDNDLDILLSGSLYDTITHEYNPNTRLYKNHGHNIFTEQLETLLMDFDHSSISWCDYNLDNNLDFIIKGKTDENATYTKLYKNNGNNTFSDQSGILSDELYRIGLSWGDYNNDGYPDILAIENSSLKLYKNNKGESFTEEIEFFKARLTGVFSWIDYDSDGDLDIYLNGEIDFPYGIQISRFYINDEDGLFSNYVDANINLLGYYGVIAWGDYDNDNDPDLLVTGDDENNNRFSKIYRNDGNNVFKDIQANIRAVIQGDVKWGDYDYDGRLDFIMTGQSASRLTILYHNDGNDNFTEYDSEMPDAEFSAVAWGDGDNDGGLDLLLLGSTGLEIGSAVWHNNYFTGNTKPNAPENLKSEIEGYGIRLAWDRATDKESTEGGLSYNVQVRKDSAWGDIVNPMADISGYRKVPQLGNAQYNDLFILDSLPIGKYYWSVQAIDQSFAGGVWSEEQSFTITRLRPNFTSDIVCFGDSTSFKDASLFSGTQIEKWHWDFGDGEISNSSDLKYEFKTPGKHLVTLSITDTADVSQSVTDTVFVLQKPDAIFSVNDVCIGSMASVVNISEIDTLSIDSWRWLFGDGDTIYQQYPGVHGYLNARSYDIQLAILAQNGCSDTTINSIQVGAYPVANISASGSPEFCNGDSLKLNVAYNPNYSYQWKLGSAPQENGDSCVFYAKISGDYKVSVTNTIVAPLGCVSESFEAVAVTSKPIPLNVPSISFVGETEFCNGDSLELATDIVPGISYEWLLNGGFDGESNSNTFTAFENGTYTLRQYITSDCPVYSLNTVDVTVNDVPEKPVISLNATEFCEGDEVILTVDKQLGVNYQWYKDDGEIPNATSNTYETLNSGNYYVIVTNASNCSRTSSITNVVVTEMPLEPTVIASGYDISDCPQERLITLSVDQATSQYNYQWKRNGVPIDGETEPVLSDYLNEGDYTVNAENGGCSNESDIVGIYYNPELPDKPEIIATGPNMWYLACTNDQALQYEWYYNNEIISGANEYLYVANQTLGTYFVKIAEENGCLVSSDAVTIPLTVTGINDANPFANLKIYPNPTPGVFTIEMDNNLFGELITRIFSQNAVEILNIKFDKSTQHFKAQVDLSGQGKGLYIISFLLDKYKAEKKLIVE